MLSRTVGRRDAAADEFAGSEFGRTQCARRVWAKDGPQQPTGMYLRRVLESITTSCYPTVFGTNIINI